MEAISMELYLASRAHAERAGIIIADTKSSSVGSTGS
jgi:hypothetical protein